LKIGTNSNMPRELTGVALAITILSILPLAHATSSFTLATNPSTVSISCNIYGCDPARTVDSTLNITSVNGFSGTVALTYTGPSGPYVTGPSSASVSSGGTTSVIITAHATGATSGNFVWTITGTGGGFTTSTTLTIDYFYCRGCL
jgi:hypothetical protein